MKTNLAYIDDVMDRAIEREADAPTVPRADRESANRNARKIIGGFRIHDEMAERKSLDDLIEKRRQSIKQFREDRLTIRNKLAKVGVAPLAVCPTGAWLKVCKDAGLFILSPNSQGQVGYSVKGFESLKGFQDSRVNAYAKEDWPRFLKMMFPDNVSLPFSDAARYSHFDRPAATLILPDPPADVAAILCKAQGFTLTVAAVADAIGFVESPSDIANAANTDPKDLWAQKQGFADYADWVKRDPIIFTEHGSATAIIAQFGDFPIEQAVVDAAVASDDFISSKPLAMENVSPSDRDMETDWRSLVARQMASVRADIDRTMYFDSRSWTGRS